MDTELFAFIPLGTAPPVGGGCSVRLLFALSNFRHRWTVRQSKQYGTYRAYLESAQRPETIMRRTLCRPRIPVVSCAPLPSGSERDPQPPSSRPEVSHPRVGADPTSRPKYGVDTPDENRHTPDPTDPCLLGFHHLLEEP